MKYIISLIISLYLTFIFVDTNIYKTIDLEKSISEDKKSLTIKNKKEETKEFDISIKEVNFNKIAKDFSCTQNEFTLMCTIDTLKYQFNNLNRSKIEDILLINNRNYNEMIEQKNKNLLLYGVIFFSITFLIVIYVCHLFNSFNKEKTAAQQDKKKVINEDSVLKDLLTVKTLYLFIALTLTSIITTILINIYYYNLFSNLGLKNTLDKSVYIGLDKIDSKNNQLTINGLSGIIENSSNYLNNKGKMINGGSNRIDIFTNDESTEQTICYFDNYLNCDIQGKKITFSVAQENLYINNINYKIAKLYIENKVIEKQEMLNTLMKAIAILYLGLLGFLVLSKTFFRIF